MNILNILIKEIKHALRDKKGMTMMILFPILLIIVLGSALTSAFDTSLKLENINVLYTIEGSSTVSDSFKVFLKESKNLGIVYEEAESSRQGMDSVKDTKYKAYIRVIEADGKILLYKNDRYNFEASMVEAVLSGIVQRNNAISEIIKVNPAALEKINLEGSRNYVSEVSLTKKRSPRAIDYYAVTMLTLIIMYASLTGGWAIKGEKIRKTGSRILCSPVKKHELFIGKTLGACLTTLLQISIVIAFSRYVFKAYWGSDIVTIMLLVVSEIIMSISIGISVAFVVKSETAMNGVLNTVIPFIVFLGGGYMPLEGFGNNILLKITAISPLKWTNQAIFQVIYGGGNNIVSLAFVLNLSISIILIILSAYLFRREAI